MNELPQNELLSAYLDGELTAAEQSEAERLLAASPAARQLLDELRTLSAALQSLPQHKLGEDLSQQVLRVAERRMLTEGEPGETPPMPLSRTILRRFVNRRAMVWTGLAVAIAVMIAVQDHRQQAPRADKEVAIATAPCDEMSEKPAGEPRPPSTIGPAPGTSDEDARADKKSSPEKKPDHRTASEELTGSPEKKMAPKSGVSGDYFNSTPSLKGETSPALATPARAYSPSATLRTKFGATMGKAAKGAYAYGDAGALNNKTGQSDSYKWYGGDGVASIGPDVLVVFCNITPEATKKKAFDKVLAANGIVLRRPSAPKDTERADRGGSAGNAKGPRQNGVSEFWDAGGRPAAEQSGGRPVADKAGETPALPWLIDGVLRQTVAADNAELVYVEATPAQVKATLEGLAAQPKAFVSVSVKSAQDESVRRVVRYFTERSAGVQSKSAGANRGLESEKQRENRQDAPDLAMAKPATPATAGFAAPTEPRKKNDVATPRRGGKAGASPEPARDKLEKVASGEGRNFNAAQAPNATPLAVQRGRPPAAAPGLVPAAKGGSQTQPGPAAQQDAPAESAASLGQSQNQREALQQPSPSQSLAQSAPRQRVLFVLRIGDGPPRAAIEAGGQSGADARKAAPPAPATPAPSK